MILKNKYLVNVVDIQGKEIYRKELFDFNKAIDAYRLQEKKYDEDKKSYTYERLDLPNLAYCNGKWFYQVGHHELEAIRVNLWGYSYDNEMFRISAQEYICDENSSRGEIK